MKFAGEYLKNKKHEIINVWEAQVNAQIPVSENTAPMVLRNILPDLLEDIGDMMVRHKGQVKFFENENYKKIIDKSIDHGRHRATSSQYTIKQMIKEYIILNGVLTEELKKENLYTTDVGIFLTYTLETSMSYSVTAFSDAIQEMQEKLVGTLAHDVRNPISAAYFAVDMMKYGDDEQKFNKTKKMAKKSLSRSVDLIEGLLDAISVKAGEGITLNFAKKNLMDELKRVHEEADEIYSNPINFAYADEKITAVFDGTAIRRVLENLITNAVKYGTPDAIIKISVHHTKEKVILEVHNQGNPIDPENQKSIFNFLGKNENDSSFELKSWGMGLAFVKMAAEAHGGYVELESDKEKGTTFSVCIQKFANSPGKVRSRLNYL